MSVGSLFPTGLINTLDLTIVRRTRSTDWGSETGAPIPIIGPVQAIVKQKTDMIRGAADEVLSVIATIYLDPNLVGLANVALHDRCSWTLITGQTFSDEEIVVLDPVAGVPGLEHTKLRVGRRIE